MSFIPRGFLISISLFFVSLFLFIIGTSHQEITGFDARFYLFAQEMLQDGLNWFPSTYHHPYADYPAAATAIIYFIASLSGGLTKFTAILPSAILAAFVVMLTFQLGNLHNRHWGFCAAIFVLLTHVFFKSARSISLDMYSVFITTLCFYLLYSADKLYKPLRTLWLFPLLLTGFIFRGPIGLVVPAGVMCVYYLIKGDIKKLFVSGSLAFLILLIATSFLLLLALKIGGQAFMHEVLRMEVFGRINNYYLPRYFYFTSSFMHYALAYPVACLMLPGIIYYGYKRKLAEYKFLYLLMGWVLIIMIGMSIPDDKKIRYILPIVPACALIAAYPFHAAASNPYFIFLRTWLRRLFFIVPAIFVILIFASHHLYAIHVADHELMIVFAILQMINVLTIIFIRHIQIREMIFLMQVLICFALSLFIIIEPVELYINRARDFVYAVEEQRKQQNAQLVFYRETADGMPIKYRINQINAGQPRFIADQQLLMQVAEPAMFVTSKEYFISLSQNIAQSLHVIAEDALGHERVMVFIKKQKESLMSKLCIHCFVAGKVQGVWFRATTQEQAKRLGITGWARNLPDGRVEVMACGDKEKLAELHAWLQRGPERAEVKELSYQELPWEEISGFETL